MTKKEVTTYSQQTFEKLKHIDENGNEFWDARELQIALEYTEWRNFEKSIKRAKEACASSGFVETDHFVGVNKMINHTQIIPFHFDASIVSLAKHRPSLSEIPVTPATFQPHFSAIPAHISTHFLPHQPAKTAIFHQISPFLQYSPSPHKNFFLHNLQKRKSWHGFSLR